MNLPEKHRIRAAFSRAATTYDAAAVLQREVCRALLDALTTTATCSPADILDAGCGTGYGARLLAERWPTCGPALRPPTLPPRWRRRPHRQPRPVSPTSKPCPFALPPSTCGGRA